MPSSVNPPGSRANPLLLDSNTEHSDAQEASFRRRWGIAPCTPSPVPPAHPVFVMREPLEPTAKKLLATSVLESTVNKPLATPVLMGKVDPTLVALSRAAALFSAFLTPGNDIPNFFNLQIALTEFRVPVSRDTSLRNVVDAVQTQFLDRMGWPKINGLEPPGGAVVCNEQAWEDVNKAGAEAKEGVVMAELEF